MKLLLIAIFLLTSTSSCVSRVEKRGYMFDLSDYQMLQEGVTSKERVIRIMGSPTLISDLDLEESWIYYSEDVKNFLFFKPDIIARTAMVVRFNEFNTIKELKIIDLASEDKYLNFATNYTLVNSHKTGFFKSIFSNVGQVKAQ